MAKQILDPAKNGYDIGMNLGFMARYFGARAPVQAIAYDVLSECTRLCGVSYAAQSARVSHCHTDEVTLDFEHFYRIEAGTKEAIIELWLHDIDFCLALKHHHDWVSMLEDEMESDWEVFGEKMYYEEIMDPEFHYQTLLEREKLMQAEIEIAAITLGL